MRKDALLAVVFITDEDDCSASNPRLYDPTTAGLSDPLGPLTSFRCFEFGVSCQCDKSASTCNRNTQGPRKNCVPGGKYLHKVDNYKTFFGNLKKTTYGQANPDMVIMAAIAGPSTPVEVGKDQKNYPMLKPSCQGGGGFAVPAIRIEALVHAFSRKLTLQEIADITNKKSTMRHWVDMDGQWRRENVASVCTSDYSTPFKEFATDLLRRLDPATTQVPLDVSACVQGPLLTAGGALACKRGDVLADPDGEAGSGDETVCKADCLHRANISLVELTTKKFTDPGSTRVINRCPAALFDDARYAPGSCGQHCPCWRLVDSAGCASKAGAPGYALEVMRSAPAVDVNGLEYCVLRDRSGATGPQCQ